MHDGAMRLTPVYETSIARAGWALGVGSLLGGLVVLALVLFGGQRDPVSLLLAWVIGTVLMGVAVTAIAVPLWLAMHLIGWHGARHAALIGFLASMTVFLAAQTYGFGLVAMPTMDSRTLLFRWLSAGAISLLLALVGAGIGMVMWRIAYRRVQFKPPQT